MHESDKLALTNKICGLFIEALHAHELQTAETHALYRQIRKGLQFAAEDHAPWREQEAHA